VPRPKKSAAEESFALTASRELLARTCDRALGQSFIGYDPYDALLSPLARLPLLGQSRSFRLALTQVVKRSPLNLRPLLGIRPGLNPKGVALFLSSMARSGDGGGVFGEIPALATRLAALRAPDVRGRGGDTTSPGRGGRSTCPQGRRRSS